MASLEQIQQDLQILPQEALNLVYQFVQLLKKTSQSQQNNTSLQEPDKPKGSVYEQFKASGLIGCVSVEEDLSTTYKQALAQGWSEKYDHR